jgi:thiol-disulfide isomerase/thioredoxin
MSLLFLTDEDFYISKGVKGPILCTNIPGFSLILFYSDRCKYCKVLEPIFNRLPGTIQGCQFGKIHVDTNKQCVNMSKQTISPITFVPTLLFYVNSRPFIRYTGPYDLNEITQFIIEVAEKLKNHQKFSNNPIEKEEHKKFIPQYTIGHPLYGHDDVTYLEFQKAYH